MRREDSWQPLSARIRGLIDAGQFGAHLLGSHDSSRVVKAFADHARAILSDLVAFANSLEKDESLKTADGQTCQAIDRVKNDVYPLLTGDDGTLDLRRINVRTGLVLLAALEGEVTYILRNDGQEVIRSLTERAFEHLNRTIVVDSSFHER